MTYSLNEIQALAKKSARGAGLPWGLADEAGKAVRWLCARDLPGCETLCALLDDLDYSVPLTHAPVSLTGAWQAPSGTLCPLHAGTALSDTASSARPRDMVRVAHPAMLIPFAANAALQSGQPVILKWAGVTASTDGRMLVLIGAKTGIWTAGPMDARCSHGPMAEGNPILPTPRGKANPRAWAALNRFAGRTYAPATEESRASGAGAGVSDND